MASCSDWGRCTPGGVGAVPCRISINLVLGCWPAPDILQIMSSAVRNLGLMVMGYPAQAKPGVACGIDFGAIAEQAGVREGITTYPA